MSYVLTNRRQDDPLAGEDLAFLRKLARADELGLPARSGDTPQRIIARLRKRGFIETYNRTAFHSVASKGKLYRMTPSGQAALKETGNAE